MPVCKKKKKKKSEFGHVRRPVPVQATHAAHSSGSLCCNDADEAKTLIPSLTDKIKDEDLQDLLDEISKLQNR